MIVAFALNICLTLSTFANNPFEQLTPLIEQEAHTWTKTIDTLSDEDQLSILNLLASTGQPQTVIHCLSNIQNNKNIEKALEEFQISLINIISCYEESILKKPSAQKSIAKNFENFQQKMVAMRELLFGYINAIYYRILYTFISKDNTDTKKLMYMFDDNGIIPQEKRIKKLPNPYKNEIN